MKVTLYSRNAVYEILRARHRQPFSLEIVEGSQEMRFGKFSTSRKESEYPTLRPR